ncbi:hypothetical protein D9M73_243500 [compost metagenome]
MYGRSTPGSRNTSSLSLRTVSRYSASKMVPSFASTAIRRVLPMPANCLRFSRKLAMYGWPVGIIFSNAALSDSPSAW